MRRDGRRDTGKETELSASNPDDPFLWLEEVEGPAALSWVEDRNAATVADLSRDPLYDTLYRRALRILDSDERIAHPTIVGDRLYNFWQDAANPRGIWRFTSWESYLSSSPAWEVVLDLDALAREEDVPWSFGGAFFLEPDFRRCLVRLSRGGSDAVEVRELDVDARAFLDEGFGLPEAKQSADWVDRDTLLVATDLGPGSMTASGYPRVARLWRRGTPLAEARTLFEAASDDMLVHVGSLRTATRAYRCVAHRIDFHNGDLHVLRDGELVKVEIPSDATPSFFRDAMLVYLRSPWEVGGQAYSAGSLLAIDFDDFTRGSRELSRLVEPGPRETIVDVSSTRDDVLVTLLDNVRGELRRYRALADRSGFDRVPLPGMGSVQVVSAVPETARYFVGFSGFTQPSTLYLGEDDGTVREVRRTPAMFDAAGLLVEQHEATSRDGTRVPYFVVRRSDAEYDGENPTLLYAYGGFEVSQTPVYSPVAGAAWLERGGVFVVANIRGGGEFGPSWHRAALKENRQRAFDDFIAVAEDLVARRITRPGRLGIMGGSNGGLLVGVALTQRPDLFAAVVVQAPLLDMRRYHRMLAGASWVAEYGDPDVAEEWEYLSRYSPYHNLRVDVDYPRVLFTTTTRDDRVHPGHARKMAALMGSHGYPVLYFENTEGGHGAGVTNEQRAKMAAVTWTFLWKSLGDDRRAGGEGRR